jgi:hypothetical protein
MDTGDNKVGETRLIYWEWKLVGPAGDNQGYARVRVWQAELATDWGTTRQAHVIQLYTTFPSAMDTEFDVETHLSYGERRVSEVIREGQSRFDDYAERMDEYQRSLQA